MNMGAEQADNPEKGKEKIKDKKDFAGLKLHDMPEKFTAKEVAQNAMAKKLGLEQEFSNDRDPEKRVQGALEAMAELRNEPLRTIDASKLKASPLDIAEAKSTPEDLAKKTL